MGTDRKPLRTHIWLQRLRAKNYPIPTRWTVAQLCETSFFWFIRHVVGFLSHAPKGVVAIRRWKYTFICCRCRADAPVAKAVPKPRPPSPKVRSPITMRTNRHRLPRAFSEACHARAISRADASVLLEKDEKEEEEEEAAASTGF